MQRLLEVQPQVNFSGKIGLDLLKVNDFDMQHDFECKMLLVLRTNLANGG